MIKKIHLIIIAWILIPAIAQAACNFHDIGGWIWSSNLGWISLSCQNTPAGVDYGLDINFDAPGPTQPMTGYAWSANAGWINFQPPGAYPTAPSTAALFTRNEGESPTSTVGKITGWAKVEAGSGNGWMKLGPISIGGTDYGVKIGTNRAFSNWSWNGGDNLNGGPEPERGLGWVSWTGNGYGGYAIARWFETLYGDIYAKANIDAPFSPPSSRFNATYLIQANGTIDPVTITSSGGAGPPYRAETFGQLNLPQQSNSYRGSLGLLDRTGILNGYYGTVTTYAGNNTSSATLGAALALAGKIYYYVGDLTIDSALTFNKGASPQPGNGTIIVDGNLIVNANVSYQAGAVAGRINTLPSAGWIVKGNVTINPAVTQLVGVFYSEGAAGITTGTTGVPATEQPLAVNGLLIAKKITLQRQYVAADNTPAEQVKFDGRAAINPPPGMGDMVKGLPALREVIP